MQKYDAVIVGAGPSGLSLAIELLRKKWRVLILDKEVLPREKVCGGFIGPENIQRLKDYGILQSLMAQGAHQVSKACLSSSNGKSSRISIRSKGDQSYGLAVSRKTLDATLMKKAQQLGADIFSSAKIVSVDDGALKGIAIRHLIKGHVEMVKTSNLIHASGVARQSGSPSDAHYFGVSAMFEDVCDMQEDVFLHFIEQGHLGINRFENGVTNVCYVADKKLFESVGGDLEALFQKFLNKNEHVRRQLASAKRVTAWKGIFVPKPSAPCFYRDHGFCVGDAVDVINPIAGAGISLGLSSGALLGKIMTEHHAKQLPLKSVLKKYEKQWKKNFMIKVKLSRLWGYLGHRAFFANMIMRLFSMKTGVFDAVFQFHHPLFESKSMNRTKERGEYVRN